MVDRSPGDERDIGVEVRRIEYGATWTVFEDGETVGSGVECCESCAMRAAKRALREYDRG